MAQEIEYDKGAEARKLFYSHFSGVLSTHSQEVVGYPFGSLTPFAIDNSGQPIILISNLAQHTKNILANPKVALTIVEKPSSLQSQAYGRLTILGEAHKVEDNKYTQVSSRYIRFFPSAQRYFEAHDFNFFRIKVIKSRFIGGFGKIFWIENDEFLVSNPFSMDEENSIITHMNEDHYETMRGYLENIIGLTVEDNSGITMVGIDTEGTHIRYKDSIYRINFETIVTNSNEAREQLIILAKA